MILDSDGRAIPSGQTLLNAEFAAEGLWQLNRIFENSFRFMPRIVDPHGRPAYGDGNTVPKIGDTINVKRPHRFRASEV